MESRAGFFSWLSCWLGTLEDHPTGQISSRKQNTTFKHFPPQLNGSVLEGAHPKFSENFREILGLVKVGEILFHLARSQDLVQWLGSPP